MNQNNFVPYYIRVSNQQIVGPFASADAATVWAHAVLAGEYGYRIVQPLLPEEFESAFAK